MRWKRNDTYTPDPAPERIVVLGVPPIEDLISLGWQTKTLTEENPNTGAVTVREIDYRLLCHRRRRSQFFVQWGDANGPIEPTRNDSGTTQKVVTMGVVSRRSLHQPSGRHEPAPNDRCVPIDEFIG